MGYGELVLSSCAHGIKPLMDLKCIQGADVFFVVILDVFVVSL